MSKPIPLSDLDRAIVALSRSAANTPDFYRALTKGEFWLLVPWHPEVEGTVMKLKNGSPFPFVRVEEKVGKTRVEHAVVLFSSEERTRESLKKARVPPRAYSLAAMPALQILEILGKMNLWAILNKSCATGQVSLPPDLMRDLASGRALQPLGWGTSGPTQVKLTLLNPADYPTDVLQPTFELLRRHRNFRAAWIFGNPDPKTSKTEGGNYRLMLLMDPRDAVLFHDFNMVVMAACQDRFDVELGLAPEQDTKYLRKLFKLAAPFYLATDYTPPKPRKK